MASPEKSNKNERVLRQRLLRRFRDTFGTPPTRLLLGFSGGGDSLALALLLRGIRRAIDIDIHLVHVDHRIRAESSADAERARLLAEELNLPFQVLRLKAHPAETHPGVGLEEAARRERFRALQSVCGPTDLVVLAHHAGDQVETMLLHILRGSGLNGLAGMRQFDVLDVPWWDSPESGDLLPIWRPMLLESQADLRSVLAGSRLTPIEDPSNNDTDLKRNAIRHLLVPAFARIEPSYGERFSELARIAADDVDLLDFNAEEALSAMVHEDGGLSLLDFRRLPPALARRVVRAWMTESIGAVPSFDRVQAVVDFASGQDAPGGMIEVGEGNVVGGFGFYLRCGQKRDLQLMEWGYSSMALPPAFAPQSVTIDGDRIIVRSPNGKNTTVSHTFPDNPPGPLSVVSVNPREKRRGLKSDWGSWLRDHSVSTWIRDDVQGIAIGGVLQWIPRVTDEHEPVDGRTVRIEVQTEE